MAVRKNILIVLSYYHPYISGVSEYAKMLAEGIAKYHDVTVLTGMHLNSLPPQEKIAGVNVVRAKPLLFLHKGYISVDMIRQFRGLARNADVINFHLPMLDAIWLTRLAPKHARLITTYQCDVQAVGGWFDRLAVGAVNQGSQLCIKRSEKVVVLSKDYAAGSAVLKPDAPVVEGFAPIKDPGLLTPARPSSDGKSLVIGFLGRFVAEKGIDVLIRAFERIRTRHPSARLLLAGDYRAVAGGSIYQQLKPRIDALGDSVQLLGRIDETELSRFYAQLDVLVLPSVNAYEAFGMVQVEAMLAGVPVVASDMRGVRIPVQLTGAGNLAPPGSDEGLASAILDTVATERCRDRQAIRQAALDVFSNQAFIERYLSLIDSKPSPNLSGPGSRK
ncbi:glycosyltransferase family 4 protein [Frateuria sp. MAH-13]|uniref:Glycosyltransferase family 4 protein n=1 Tax=Frateuria flava TaxID=2821489 RepID=A0ABS4DQY8_9GAMM|nr:glycosyltransferase family 4 protein [Frateuria flava]MBP1475472.1 glycosyltransferase family 4 protein [Frateuria flava]